MQSAHGIKGIILTGDSSLSESVGWSVGSGLVLPMVNVSMVERILEGYQVAGIRETLIASCSDIQEISSLCGNGARWKMTLTYLDSSSKPTTNDIAAFTSDSPFLATQGAVLLEAKTYLNAVKEYYENRPWGIKVWQDVRNDADTTESGMSGVYLLTSNIYNLINEHTKLGVCSYPFDTGLEQLLNRGGVVLRIPLDQQPYRVQNPESYLDSNKRLLKYANTETVPEIISDNFSSPNIVLREHVIVDPTAELERSQIGPSVCIGPGVHIGHGATIEHSVIMADADIGDGASISHAIIGKNISVENRAVIHGRANRVTVICLN